MEAILFCSLCFSSTGMEKSNNFCQGFFNYQLKQTKQTYLLMYTPQLTVIG